MSSAPNPKRIQIWAQAFPASELLPVAPRSKIPSRYTPLPNSNWGRVFWTRDYIQTCSKLAGEEYLGLLKESKLFSRPEESLSSAPGDSIVRLVPAGHSDAVGLPFAENSGED